MKEAVEKRSDLLFPIKLMPIKPGSRAVAETIACTKSMELLEAAFAKQELPEPGCEGKVIEQTKALGIRSTPTLILPNGQIEPGYKPLEKLLEIIDQAIVSN